MIERFSVKDWIYFLLSDRQVKRLITEMSSSFNAKYREISLHTHAMMPCQPSSAVAESRRHMGEERRKQTGTAVMVLVSVLCASLWEGPAVLWCCLYTPAFWRYPSSVSQPYIGARHAYLLKSQPRFLAGLHP